MTLILSTQTADIHKCPDCEAQCAVEKTALTAASNAGQTVRIACHKCDAVFLPLNDNRPAQPGAMPADETMGGNQQPADRQAMDKSRASAQARLQNQMRFGKCPQCAGHFSIPASPMTGEVTVECPHCALCMPPILVGRVDARTDVVAARRNRARIRPVGRSSHSVKLLASFIVGGFIIAAVLAGVLFEATPRLPTLEGLTATPAAHIAVADTSFQQIVDEQGPAILVTLTLSNLGTASSIPQPVKVSLVDADGSALVTRMVATYTPPMAAGETRAVMARFTAPSVPVADVEVTLRQD